MSNKISQKCLCVLVIIIFVFGITGCTNKEVETLDDTIANSKLIIIVEDHRESSYTQIQDLDNHF